MLIALKSRLGLVSSLALALSLFSGSAWPQDVKKGQLLYEANCGGCHYVWARPRVGQPVKDLAGLREMVAQWAPQVRTKRSFTPQEREDIVQYLNVSLYRFGLAPMEQKKR